MIVDSLEQFIDHVQDNWIGKNISVAKINSTAIEMRLNEVEVTPWQKVDRRIQERHSPDSNFLVLAGKEVENAAADHSAKLRNLVIHVDGGTVFDVRDNRLVLLSDQEVIQLKLKV